MITKLCNDISNYFLLVWPLTTWPEKTRRKQNF